MAVKTASLPVPGAVLPDRSVARLAAWLAPALLALVARLANGPLTVDDAFITFRYADNLRLGHGLVYNPGEAVLGTTTPLYAALLALIPAPPGSLPSLAPWLNATLDAAACVLLVWLGLRLSGQVWVGALAATGYALAPMSIAFSAGGMETPLFVLLVLSSLGCWLAGRRGPALGCAALATLTRPEGGLVATLLLLDALRLRRHLPWRLALLYAVLLAPWTLYAWLVYGSPLPHSMAAKAVTYQVDPGINLAALAFSAGLPGFSVLPLAEVAGSVVPWLVGCAVALIALYGFARQAGRLALCRAPRAWPLLLFAPIYALAYSLAGLRGVRLFHWYLTPLVPFYLLYLAVGLAAVAARLRLEPPRLAAAAFALVVVWDVAALGLSRGWLERPFYPVGLDLTREAVYGAIGAELRSRLAPDDVVAAPEIGALGYASQARILDTVGLVSPGVSGYYPLPREQLVADNAVPPQLIQDRQPRYVVALDQFVRRSLLPSPWFRRHYDLVRREPARVWMSDAVLLFRRNDQP